MALWPTRGGEGQGVRTTYEVCGAVEAHRWDTGPQCKLSLRGEVQDVRVVHKYNVKDGCWDPMACSGCQGTLVPLGSFHVTPLALRTPAGNQHPRHAVLVPEKPYSSIIVSTMRILHPAMATAASFGGLTLAPTRQTGASPVCDWVQRWVCQHHAGARRCRVYTQSLPSIVPDQDHVIPARQQTGRVCDVMEWHRHTYVGVPVLDNAIAHGI